MAERAELLQFEQRVHPSRSNDRVGSLVEINPSDGLGMIFDEVEKMRVYVDGQISLGIVEPTAKAHERFAGTDNALVIEAVNPRTNTALSLQYNPGDDTGREPLVKVDYYIINPNSLKARLRLFNTQQIRYSSNSIALTPNIVDLLSENSNGVNMSRLLIQDGIVNEYFILNDIEYLNTNNTSVVFLTRLIERVSLALKILNPLEGVSKDWEIATIWSPQKTPQMEFGEKLDAAIFNFKSQAIQMNGINYWKALDIAEATTRLGRLMRSVRLKIPQYPDKVMSYISRQYQSAADEISKAWQNTHGSVARAVFEMVGTYRWKEFLEIFAHGNSTDRGAHLEVLANALLHNLLSQTEAAELFTSVADISDPLKEYCDYNWFELLKGVRMRVDGRDEWLISKWTEQETKDMGGVEYAIKKATNNISIKLKLGAKSHPENMAGVWEISMKWGQLSLTKDGKSVDSKHVKFYSGVGSGFKLFSQNDLIVVYLPINGLPSFDEGTAQNVEKMISLVEGTKTDKSGFIDTTSGVFTLLK